MATPIATRDGDEYREIHVNDHEPAVEWVEKLAADAPDDARVPAWCHPDDADALGDMVQQEAMDAIARREDESPLLTQVEAETVALVHDLGFTQQGAALAFSLGNYECEAYDRSTVATNVERVRQKLDDARETVKNTPKL